MVDIVISIATKVAEYLVAPVGRQLGYLFCYKGNIAELEDEVKKLDRERRRLQGSVDADKNQGCGIEEHVQEWLARANTISQEAENFIEDEKKANKSCFKGLCPNLISRYQFSRQAKKKALDVKKIHEEGHFQTISYRLPLPGAGSAPLQGYQAFESRATTLKKIMDALRDDKINKIGVWGMGGVGKTTLVKQVAKLAEDDKLFDKVVMVAVSREQNLGKIQTEIAELLDLKIEEKSELGRAGRLSEILKKKKLLIILDDIWAKLKLEAVGIPYGEDHKGLKIVVTSRSKDVLSQDMGTQENFEVRLLSGDEAWQLFQDTAGDCIQNFNLQSAAMKIAEKCGDLPIAIVTVAKALKEKSVPYWEDALRQLTSPTKTDIRGMPEDVYKSLELSYNYLENEDAKSLFLLCGLLGYGDISMHNLFKYSVGLRLFPSVKTLEDSANRLQVLVDSLKSSSLLLDIHKEEYVKMHDVVRDVARDIASKDPHQFVVIEATQSEDWSEICESTRYIYLSSSNQGTLVLPQTLVFPKLEFFLMVNERRLSENIPDSFFNGMGKLKVLRLFGMKFSSPPLSLQSLANLRTLCLDCCTLGDVAGIGELKQLEVLSFRGSGIQQLPKEIAQLTCLRLLDLSNCRQLRIIPPNILSNLSRLEHLCIEPQLKDEEINQESNAGLSELKHLCRLTTLNVALQDLELLPKDTIFEKLTRYKIFIGGEWHLDSRCETERALKLEKANRSLHLMDGIGKLLKKTEELSLWELSGTQSVLYDFDKEDFLQLKHLNVSCSPEIQYIMDSRYPRVQEHAVFPSLESLNLNDMISLEKVCHGLIPEGSFVNLKTLKMWGCHGLKIFLSLTVATGFLHLEEINIEYCNAMQQIIAYERKSEIIEDGHATTTLQPFPKLRYLFLSKLPELMNFSSKLETSSMSLTTNARLEGNRDIHTSFFNDHQVSFPNLEMLELRNLLKPKEIWHHQLPLGSFYNLHILKVYKCPCLLNLIPSHLIQSLNHLKHVTVNTCEVLEHVFDLQGLDGNTKILPKIEYMWLGILPRLRYIISNEDNNDNVICLFSPSTLLDFHNLKLLSIKGCGNKVKDEGHVNTPAEDVVLFSEKVSFPNLETLDLIDLPKLKEIWHHQLPLDSFSNLQILEVYKCPCLLNLIPCHLIQSFKNLEEIKVENCEVLKYVFDLQGLDRNVEILPKLETLELIELPGLMCVICDEDKNDSMRCLFSPSMPMNFRNLKYLSIKYCGKEDKDKGYVHNPSEDGTVLFNEKVSFPNLEKLKVFNLPKLKEIWHHQLPLDSFSKLQFLEVYQCPCLLKFIPCHLLQSFKNLKVISVSYCEVLEHVFDLQGLDRNVEILPKLKTLELRELPGLKCVMPNGDKNDSMRCLFSLSMPMNFHNLKYLTIQNCGKDDKDKADINTPIQDVVFFREKVSFPDGVCYQAFESRAFTFNNIMDALRDGHINRIGVWAMGGVGKTTLLKQVFQLAKQLQLFTVQFYIDASWTRDSDNLQQGISEMQRKFKDKIELQFEADELGGKKKILIILDDLWERVDLEEVGLIPSKDDENEIEWKIVLSSRDGDLLCKDMGAQICFQVEQLLPQEAWSLFKKTAGDSVEENLELRPIAIQVVEEYCEGLPIAIVTIAKALKDETMAVWKNVLEELRMSAPTNIRGVGNKVYSCLEWSYTHLKSDDVKSLFLLCGMLGYDDISVDLLLQYCLGLDLFDNIDSLEKASNKLLTLVQILKASNLLFFKAGNNSVRMHDVVSDVAKAIASKDPHPFIVREDVGFKEWSETDESKRCTFISLNCRAAHVLPQRLVYPELQFFILQNNNPSLNIPNIFFEGMKKLKVLDLSKMNFEILPSSLDSLANLRTLRLHGCELVEIALIGKLTKLEVLSLVGSTIPQLHEEMAQLTNLRWLDLNDCEKLKVIPRNVLSSLSRLECLCMKSSFTQWADEGESNASLSELNHLSYLTTLHIEVPNVELLPKDILFENLTRYTIFVGDMRVLERDCKTKRALNLEGVLHLGDAISKLLERSEELEFSALSGSNYVLYPSDRESFVELKHLKVSSSDEIQYIIDSKDQRFLQHVAFPLLESLVLERLNNLEEVWHGSVPIGSFGNLKTLNMSYCHKLKFLFLLSTARGLSQLEEMKIEDCDVMQQIIVCERESEIKEDGHGGTNLQLFPKLRILELNRLPEFINFTPGLETTPSTSLNTNAMLKGYFSNHQFSSPILEELTLIDLPKLKDLWLHQLLLRSCNLRKVKVYSCPYQLHLVSSRLQHIDVEGCKVDCSSS